MTCETCRYHDALKAVCRRRPPTLVIDNYSGPKGGWPPVSAESDWCGDYKESTAPNQQQPQRAASQPKR